MKPNGIFFICTINDCWWILTASSHRSSLVWWLDICSVQNENGFGFESYPSDLLVTMSTELEWLQLLIRVKPNEHILNTGLLQTAYPTNKWSLKTFKARKWPDVISPQSLSLSVKLRTTKSFRYLPKYGVHKNSMRKSGKSATDKMAKNNYNNN